LFRVVVFAAAESSVPVRGVRARWGELRRRLAAPLGSERGGVGGPAGPAV